MHTIFDPNFDFIEKLTALGFEELKERDDEIVYHMPNNNIRHGQHITIYIHHDKLLFEEESISTAMSIYIGSNTDYLEEKIYSGIRPYTEEQFYHIFSSLFPSKEYMKKLQNSILEYSIKNHK